MKTYYAHDPMKEWNPTWKWYHLPLWAKVRLRKLAIQNKAWIPNTSTAGDFINLPLFSHYGSIKRDNLCAIMTQPYGDLDKEAAQWAHDMDCHLEIMIPAPRHPDTRGYIFHPKISQ